MPDLFIAFVLSWLASPIQYYVLQFSYSIVPGWSLVSLHFQFQILRPHFVGRIGRRIWNIQIFFPRNGNMSGISKLVKLGLECDLRIFEQL